MIDFPIRVENPVPQTRPETKAVIFGTSSGGTTFLSRVLQAHGYMLGHEGLADNYYGGVGYNLLFHNNLRRYIQYPSEFGPFFQMTRDPLRQVGSQVTFGFDWLKNLSYGPDDFGAEKATSVVHAAMLYWHCWHKRAEALSSWQFRLESIADPKQQYVVGDLFNRLGVSTPPDLATIQKVRDYKPVSRTRDKNYLPSLTWNDFLAIDRPLARRMMAQAREFGYDVVKG